MNDNDSILPSEITPVIENEEIIVRQDAEWPVPAFYIVSLREHIGSIADVSVELAGSIGICLHHVRRLMRTEFGIERAQIYHEEKILSPHFHAWILPLWNPVLSQYHIAPKIYDANIRAYIDLFRYEDTKRSIINCNTVMAKGLSESEWFIENGFRSRII